MREADAKVACAILERAQKAYDNELASLKRSAPLAAESDWAVKLSQAEQSHRKEIESLKRLCTEELQNNPDSECKVHSAPRSTMQDPHQRSNSRGGFPPHEVGNKPGHDPNLGDAKRDSYSLPNSDYFVVPSGEIP